MAGGGVGCRPQNDTRMGGRQGGEEGVATQEREGARRGRGRSGGVEGVHPAVRRGSGGFMWAEGAIGMAGVRRGSGHQSAQAVLRSPDAH